MKVFINSFVLPILAMVAVNIADGAIPMDTLSRIVFPLLITLVAFLSATEPEITR